MTRRQVIVTSAIVGVLVLAVLGLIGLRHMETLKRAVPDWLAGAQPPDSLAPDLPTVSAAESWAAARPPHIAAMCQGYSAGSRVRRTYPGTLAESPHSFIRAGLDFQVGG